MVFEVTLDNNVAGGTVVPYTFLDVTATGGLDYNNIPGPALVFTGFQNEVKFITVPIIDDLIEESDDEDFTVQLGTPTNSVGLSGGGDARAESRTMTRRALLIPYHRNHNGSRRAGNFYLYVDQ